MIKKLSEGFFRKFVPANTMFTISGVMIDKMTYMKFEEGYVRDFFTAKELNGLCIHQY